jgi:hypothetical protein
MPYPNLLAAGVTDEGTFTPFELFAGESTIVTSQGTVGTTSVPQFVPVVRNTDGTISAWSDTYASMTGTFSGAGTANDTITLHGVVFTLVAAATTSHQVTIGGTAAETAANFAAKADAVSGETLMHAAAVGPVVTLSALTAGTAGNALAIAESGTSFSFTGAATTLAGGAVGAAGVAIGISAQAGIVGGHIPYFTGGSFNWKAITWPASITTLEQARAVFDRTPIYIDKLLGVSTRMTIP